MITRTRSVGIIEYHSSLAYYNYFILIAKSYKFPPLASRFAAGCVGVFLVFRAGRIQDVAIWNVRLLPVPYSAFLAFGAFEIDTGQLCNNLDDLSKSVE